MNAIDDAESPIKIPGHRPFITKEQRLCTKSSAHPPYWNLEDELCTAVLELGRNPERFPLIRAFFPVVRTAVSFAVPLSESWAPFWWAFTFYAGWQFGMSLPLPAREIIEAFDQAELENLLGLIQQVNGQRLPTPETFGDVFPFIWSLKPRGLEKAEVQHLVLSILLNAFVAGVVGALWKENSTNFPFVKAVEIDYSDPALPLHVRAIQISASNDFSLEIPDRLKHPLLKAAEAHYPVTPTERSLLLPFFHKQLSKLCDSENVCPAAELDLVDWVSAGLKYGRTLFRNSPHAVAVLRRELGENQFAASFRCCGSIRQTAGASAPLSVTRAALDWHSNLGWPDPVYYGQRLDRVVRIADLAIWIRLLENR